MEVKEALQEINQRMEAAKERAGRQDPVQLVAVTKTVSDDRVAEAIAAGVIVIAENRPQELVKRMERFQDEVSYHMIGRLQTNKVRHIIEKTALIHSLDRMSLAQEINRRAEAIGKVQDCLIQVNVSGEETKAGLSEKEVLVFVEEMAKMPYINIKGLMTMAPLVDDERIIRQVFRDTVRVKEQIANRHYDHVSMEELSMGMTGDFEIAIEEGATMVRVGSGIFGSR